MTGDPDDDDDDDDVEDPDEELDADDAEDADDADEDEEPFAPLELDDELDDVSDDDDWPSLGPVVFNSKQPPMSVVSIAKGKTRFTEIRKTIEPLFQGQVCEWSIGRNGVA